MSQRSSSILSLEHPDAKARFHFCPFAREQVKLQTAALSHIGSIAAAAGILGVVSSFCHGFGGIGVSSSVVEGD